MIPGAGWADSMPTWASSSWSAGAFGGVAPARPSQLEVIYSTDAAANGAGFQFDEVTVTDIELQIADTESDVCAPPTFLFSDGFEAGDTQAWGTSCSSRHTLHSAFHEGSRNHPGALIALAESAPSPWR